MTKAQCTENIRHPIISLTEEKSCIRINNPSRKEIKKIKIDGCEITDGHRCDHLLITSLNEHIFIELKGTDIAHAIKQLSTTVEYISPPADKNHSCIVVCRRYPSNSPEIDVAKKRMKRRFRNLSISIKCSPHEITVQH